MSGTPFFSVIIPTFNRAHLLGKAIQSVMDQTFTDWELIVVDDGSTDHTAGVVHSFEDRRIRYYYQENQELNAARNAGIDFSTGKYICILDDDDHFLPDHLECFYRNIISRKTPVAIFRNGLIISMESGKTIRIPNFVPEKHGHPVSFFLFGYPNLMALAIHREVFETTRFDVRFKLFDDTHFLVRALLKFPFYQGENYTCVYVHHLQARSITYFQEKSKMDNLFQCVDDLFENHAPDIIAFTHQNIEQELKASILLVQANKSMVSGQYLPALKGVFRALRFNRSSRNLRHSMLTLIRLVYRYLFKN